MGRVVLPAFLERAAGLRATHNLRTPDAIHSATALETGCALFVANDPGFRSVAGLNRALLDEIVAST